MVLFLRVQNLNVFHTFTKHLQLKDTVLVLPMSANSTLPSIQLRHVSSTHATKQLSLLLLVMSEEEQSVCVSRCQCDRIINRADSGPCLILGRLG